jgi:hypothetical protein
MFWPVDCPPGRSNVMVNPAKQECQQDLMMNIVPAVQYLVCFYAK